MIRDQYANKNLLADVFRSQKTFKNEGFHSAFKMFPGSYAQSAKKTSIGIEVEENSSKPIFSCRLY